MNDSAIFRFGKIDIFNNYIISEPYEGVTIGDEELKTILDYCENLFKDRPFGYICRRVHSYSVNPMVYLKTNMGHNVKAVAIVVQSRNGISIANMEKHFSPKPFQIFIDEEKAKEWIIEKLDTSE